LWSGERRVALAAQNGDNVLRIREWRAAAEMGLRAAEILESALKNF
jgi:hypothetical protein